MDTEQTVIVVAGGDPIGEDVADNLPEGAYVIAADSGLDHAISIGASVDLIVGDLDSVSAASLAASTDTPIEQYPAKKARTDLELALDAAVRLNPDRVIVVGGHGGRVDHFLANALVIASPTLAACSVEWLCSDSHIYVVRDAVQLHETTGDIVSLIAIGGPATGVTTIGLEWNLDNETLEPFSARGISNTLMRPFCHIRVTGGTLLVILAR